MCLPIPYVAGLDSCCNRCGVIVAVMVVVSGTAVQRTTIASSALSQLHHTGKHTIFGRVLPESRRCLEGITVVKVKKNKPKKPIKMYERLVLTSNIIHPVCGHVTFTSSSNSPGKQFVSVPQLLHTWGAVLH
jgi:hypothetical protein